MPTDLASLNDVMICDDYVNWAVSILESASPPTSSSFQQRQSLNGTGNSSVMTSQSAGRTTDETLAAVNYIAVMSVSIFGIAGNVLNLVVLTRRQLQRSVFSWTCDNLVTIYT